MKILQINTVYGRGSVGRIMSDLYDLTERAGDEPYVAFSRSAVPEGINGYRIGNAIDFARHVFMNVLLDRGGFASRRETIRFLEWIDEIKPDVIHLHNIHGFYLEIELLFDYIKRHDIPVVWTLHDCWAFTGHCAHFDYIGCNRWKSQCEKCPQHLQSYPYSLIDGTRENYKRKRNAFTGVNNITLVAPSHWLASLANESFLNGYPIKIIPNGIDLNTFKPVKVEDFSREYKKKVILGVANVWTERKGLSYFLKLAEKLDETYEILLVGVNKSQEKMLKRQYLNKIIPIRRTDSVEELTRIYSKAAVFVNPTLEDSFPTTNLEALACGTPVITFRTGGSPEALLDDNGNLVDCGVIVEKGDIEGLIQGIKKITTETKERYSATCRKQAERFEKENRFKEYINIYKQTCYNKR